MTVTTLAHTIAVIQDRTCRSMRTGSDDPRCFLYVYYGGRLIAQSIIVDAGELKERET